MNNRHNRSVSKQNFQHASLLVVEDSDDHWHLISMALMQALPEVKTVRAATADEASTYLHNCLLDGNELPKLILMDLYIPDREDAWHLLQEIKQPDSSFKQVPVVILSYSDDLEDITESYFYGSTSYVTKPINIQGWQEYFQMLRTYWWETVTLPSDRFMM
ncbi:response regulator [Spirosoma taeanense]|uniref:Response regulator n=1 Tax=Spirosoma taeanense TaxID=2735870 RepID=A0A6M5Y6Q1_9BACT|nr:response regulator [Spirosoma taeanense]QJW89030.1 response regulator [Spirosoma taeanense]